MASAATQDDINKLVSTIQSLKNKDLARICYENYVAKSGNKADLQRRIIALIDSAVHNPNPQKFTNIKNSILRLTANYRVSNFGPAARTSSPSYNNGYSSMSSPYNASGVRTATTPPSVVTSGKEDGYTVLNGILYYTHQGLQFKPSPFYEVDTPLGDLRQCEPMLQHRTSITIPIGVSAFPELEQCSTNPALRVMIFCAASRTGMQDITFPYQCEIKLNGGDIKASTRGLKNKPGSTRPVDITDLLRLKPTTYTNTLEFSYALTNKRFYLAVYLCKTYTVPDLTSRIKKSRITKASVIREITQQAQDPDIVATSTVLSLKCPLTYMRLSTPVRGTSCKHMQCFDAASYLQLQQQGPQWICPVCSNPASFESLAVDEYGYPIVKYVKDILENTAEDVEQVTIEPDGTWHTGKAKYDVGKGGERGGPSTPGMAGELDYLDDNEILIATPATNGRYGNGVSPGVPNSVASRDTTATPSQTARVPAASSTSNTNKRPRAEVIDLTLSDDDDGDARQPPMKRQQTNDNSSYMTLPSYGVMKQ